MYSPAQLAEKLSQYIIDLKEEITAGCEFRNGDDQVSLKSIETFVTDLNRYPHNYVLSWSDIAEGLKLMQHPEGGYYRRFSWTKETSRTFYLLPAGTVSAWHRLKGTREVCKWMSGGTLIMPQINNDFAWSASEQVEQDEDVVMMEGRQKEELYDPEDWGKWFGAYHNDGYYSFVICECSPPFEFSKFQLATEHDVNQFKVCNLTYGEVIDRLVPTFLPDKF